MIDLDTQDANQPILLRNSKDSYSMYAHLNKLKKELVWGISEPEEIDDYKPPTLHPAWLGRSPIDTISPDIFPPNIKGHNRKFSSVSSVSSSDPDSENYSEGGDSVISEELENMTDLTSALKGHLNGLQDCLTRLTETAHFITKKYQDEFSE